MLSMSVSSKTLRRSHLVKMHLFQSQQANTYSLAWVGTGAHIWTNNCSWRRDYSHSFGLVLIHLLWGEVERTSKHTACGSGGGKQSAPTWFLLLLLLLLSPFSGVGWMTDLGLSQMMQPENFQFFPQCTSFQWGCAISEKICLHYYKNKVMVRD